MSKNRIIGSKAEIRTLLSGLDRKKDLVGETEKKILGLRIRFPALEYAAKSLYEELGDDRQIPFSDRLVSGRAVGAYVIAGITLQLRLERHYKESFKKAEEYLVEGNRWYVCDIISERVFGHALLHYPDKTVQALNIMLRHKSHWVQRGVGAAIHYAVKKGLPESFSEQCFQMVLSCGDTADLHVKKGIGWAAKTIAKFHPGIIKKYEKEIEGLPGQWMRTKIRIGLGRSYKYAPGYYS